MIRILDLFAGTCSVRAAMSPSAVLSVDNDPRSPADVHADVMTWDYKGLFQPGDFDAVWASPPCTEYSNLRYCTNKPRDLPLADGFVLKAIEIIEYLQPRVWVIENPLLGLLRTRPFMQGKPFIDVTYCMYGCGHRKPTRLWTNATGVTPRVCTLATPCEQSELHPVTGKLRHPDIIGAPRGRRTDGAFARVHSADARKAVPQLLIRALLA